MNEMSPNGLVGVHCPVKAGKYCLQSFFSVKKALLCECGDSSFVGRL